MANQMIETVARAMAQENGTDFEEEMAIATSIARMEREMMADLKREIRIARNMRGYVPITENDFRGY